MNTTSKARAVGDGASLLRRLTVVLAAMLISGSRLPAEDDILFADFERDSYNGWTAGGTAFGAGPAEGPLPGQMAVEGFAGKRLVNSFYGGDGSTGSLTSDEFTVSKPYIAFLIGGGGFPDKTCLNLVIEGRLVRSATGPNTQPGGSERLTPQGWDVAEFVGKNARLVVMDDATGGWGHVTVDRIVFTDTKPPLWLRGATREITAEKHWLHFPIKTGAPKRRVTLTLDGVTHPPLDLELADAAPEWWAPLDVSAFRGKKLSVTVETLRDDSTALKSITQDDAIRGADPLYREPLRPQFHFSPRRGWCNDPNGLVFHEGTWHLYFQHNPYGWNWGNMHWSHATSPDLLHWTEQGVAMSPDAMGPMFSGSGVVDWKNTSGLGRDGKPPLCFLYTAAGDPTVQCLASSTDGGKTLAKFPGNPVLRQITPGNRDPKVLWDERTQRWVMVLYVEKNKQHTIQFFTSPDLKSWTYRSEIAGLFECPDFFELPVDGDESRKLWVLTAASSEYLLGTFDGETFTPVSAKLPGHRGKGFYAAQTYSDAPKSRRIQIGWLQAPSPGMPFNQGMSLPLELGLRTTPEGPRLTMRPAVETDALSMPGAAAPNEPSKPRTLSSSVLVLDEKLPELVRLDARFAPGSASQVSFTFRGATIVYDATKQEFIINGHRAPAPLIDGRQQFTAFLDRTTLEVFASAGLTYIPLPFIAKPTDLTLTATAAAGEAVLDSLEVRRMRSIWQDQGAINLGTDGFAQSGDVKIHYVTAGKGPLVVMIHGFPDYWYTWRKQMPALAEKFQVVAIDQRGYNMSDQPVGVENYAMAKLVGDVRAVVQHFQREKATVVGHDWGGMVAWSFAMSHPEMTDRLVILNLPHPNGLLRELATNPEQQRNSAYARHFQKPEAASQLTAEGLAGWVTDETARPHYLAAFHRSSFEGMLNYYKANYPREPYTVPATPYPVVKCPVLMFHGLKDKALLPSALNDTWKWIGNDLTLVTVPDADHWVQQDAADFVTRTMVGWMNR